MYVCVCVCWGGVSISDLYFYTLLSVCFPTVCVHSWVSGLGASAVSQLDLLATTLTFSWGMSSSLMLLCGVCWMLEKWERSSDLDRTTARARVFVTPDGGVSQIITQKLYGLSNQATIRLWREAGIWLVDYWQRFMFSLEPKFKDTFTVGFQFLN